jgi:carotenoid 1,2-hydratase
VQRDARTLSIGPSHVTWDGNALEFQLDEVTVPLPSRIRGRVRLYPAALTGARFALDAAGRHHWSPIAPCARVEVALDRPGLSWNGAGYFDANAGEEPLENAFTDWDWSRARLRDATAVTYDVRRRTGDALGLALRFSPSGAVEPFAAPAATSLGRTGWRIARQARSEDAAPRLVRTLEDTPFYARSLVETNLLGERVHAVHESLSLDRFRTRWVRMLLPFRMPRVRR